MAHPLYAGLSRLSAALTVTLLPARAWACAVCIGWGEGQEPLATGFYWSALLLTALPFAVVVTIGAWIGYVVRHARRGRGCSSTGNARR